MTPATAPVQRSFLVVSLVLGLASLASLASLLLDMRRVRRMRSGFTTTFLRGFSTQLLSDVVLVLLFVPADVLWLHDSFAKDSDPALVNEEHPLGPATSTVPVAVQRLFGVMFATGLCVAVCGSTLVAFQSWYMLVESQKLRKNICLPWRLVIVFNLAVFLLGLTVALQALEGDLIGSYRNLVYGFTSFGSARTGVPVLVLILLNATAMSVFLEAVHLIMVKRVKMDKTCNGAQIKFFRRLGNKILAIFLLTWTPLGITIVFALAQAPLPAGFDLFVLLLIKARPILDVVVVSTSSVLKAQKLPTLMLSKAIGSFRQKTHRFRSRSDSHGTMSDPAMTSPQSIAVQHSGSVASPQGVGKLKPAKSDLAAVREVAVAIMPENVV